MLLTLLFFAWPMESQVVKFTGTEVYEPLSASDVLVDPEGRVFVIDFEEKRIHLYTANGERQKTFGRAGKGPGEFSFPREMFYHGNKLFVKDMGTRSMKVFDKMGVYQTSYSLPAMNLSVARVPEGWIYANFSPLDHQATQIEVVFANDDFSETQVVLTLPKDGAGEGFRLEMGPGGGVPKVPYNPASGRNFLVGTPDGSRVFVSQPGPFKIHTIDVAAKKVADIIEREDKPVPFNKDWGQKSLKALKERPTGGMKLEFVANFPEAFPLIRGLQTTPEGYLAVLKWTANPDGEPQYLILDHQGAEKKLPYAAANLTRILGMHDGYAYLSAFNAEEEEAYILKCRARDIDTVAEAYPIPDDLEDGARVMIQMQ